VARCGERGRAVAGGGATRATGMATSVRIRTGDTTSWTGTTVTFLGGQSMFLLKLGASDEVSSRCPTLVSAGTHSNTNTTTSAAVRVSTCPKPLVEGTWSKTDQKIL
jgi:hypothetical protein